MSSIGIRFNLNRLSGKDADTARIKIVEINVTVTNGRHEKSPNVRSPNKKVLTFRSTLT